MILKTDEYYFLLPNGLGDSLIMKCIHKKLEDHFGAKINYIVKNNHAYIFESSGINCHYIEQFDREKIYSLADDSPQPQKGQIYVAHPTFHNDGILDKKFLNHEISFKEMYAIFFGIEIKKLKCIETPEGITENTLSKVEKICGTRNVSNVILFAPEMNSGADYEKIQPVWSDCLYNKLIDKYKYVLRNTTRVDSKERDNQVLLTLEEIISIGCNCKCVITSRSGLADILYGCAKSIKIIYPNIGFYQLFRMDYIWDLKRNNVEEYIIHISEYFKQNNYKKICIYGYGEGGQRIRYSMKSEGMDIEYAVDRKAESEEVDIYRPDMRLPEADIMVICVKETKENISKALKYKFSGILMEMKEIMEMASLPKW